MRSLAAALILVAVAVPAQAQMTCRDGAALPEPVAPADATPVPHHFHRVPGAGLACAVSQQEGDAMSRRERPVSYLPCLKVGAVAVADDRAVVEQLLGPPTQVRDLDLRTEARVYPIRQRSIPEPYYVVTYQDKVVVAVQLIGPPTEMPATFSGLSLGDSAQSVLDALGRPPRRCMTHVNGPETWMWPPFPIGVDILDGRVVGLKATWPAGRPTPE